MKLNPYSWRLSMDPDKIELETMSKMFEYEKWSRELDDCDDPDVLRNCAKAYIKLYLKQQEVVATMIR